jgi:hypothetical protein
MEISEKVKTSNPVIGKLTKSPYLWKSTRWLVPEIVKNSCKSIFAYLSPNGVL